MKNNAQSGDTPSFETLGPRAVVHQGKLIQVCEQRVRLPSGRETKFETARRPPGVRILVVSPGAVLLSKEWRHEHGGWDYRLPGGKIADDWAHLDSEIAADRFAAFVAKAASRELHEETGLNLHHMNLELLHVSTCGATVEWDLHYFVGRVPAPFIPARRQAMTEEGEVIEPGFYGFDEVVDLFCDGRLLEDRSASVLMRFILSQRGELRNGRHD